MGDNNELLDISYFSNFDLKNIRREEPTLWRYRHVIPIREDSNIVSFNEGFTPLSKINIEGKQVFVKEDFLFPTGSYKDRGASVLISKAKELGIKKVIQDSSGNAGCSIACYAAKAKIECDIYVPSDTAPAKLAQIQMYGANVIKVEGTREETAHAAFLAAKNNYYASHVWNPFFFQGTKTFSFEVCEQLNWKNPDTVVLPAGNGSLLIGAYIGFSELFYSGIIPAVPKIIAVQSKFCAPLYEAFRNRTDNIPKVIQGKTLAEGIAINSPARGKQILGCVKKTGGKILVVDEEQIISALFEMGNQGYYIEPTSAAVIAGLKDYLSESDSDELIISVFTGTGLKSSDKIIKLLLE
ncbi:MAG: threonine synthase [Ignavibacteriaceae bacterium]|nr:threonine synthase [Ignavibacteriaceae bacterium]